MSKHEHNFSKFSRGSEWRRWDLHVHTPESVLNNQFKGGWDAYVHRLYTEAIRNDIAVIGITDYFLLDGYKRLRQEYLPNPERLASIFAEELKEDPSYLERIRRILLLPNIEFRLDKFVETKNKASARLTMHVLFSDDVAPEEIESLFLTSLKIDFKGAPNHTNEKRPLSRSTLEHLGERLKRDHEKFQDKPSLFVGCMNASVDDDEIMSALRSAASVFKNKYMLVLAEEYMSEIPWDGAGHHVRKVLYQKCDALFSANEKTINNLLSPDFATAFGKVKPCLWGSDAHSLDKLFASPGGKQCWLKADPTFAGLRQVLNEPAARCHIGDIPSAVEATKHYHRPYIANLRFSKRSGSTLAERWFDGCELEFNSGMVAVIGNKGSGKSALADTIALLGATHVDNQYFSFLRSERFRKRDGGAKSDRSQEFQAACLWSGGEESTRALSHVVSPEELERVRYLPQGYLEKICNERDEQAQESFRAELDRVIFSHVEVSARLGKTSLSELIDLRTDEVIRSASNLKRHVRDLNHQIAVLEQKLTPASIAALEEKISSKKRELRQLDEGRPAEVINPASSKDLQFAANVDQLQALELHKQTIAEIVKQTALATQRVGKLRIALQSATKVRERLRKFQDYYDSVLPDVERELATLGINSSGILTACANPAPVDAFIESTRDEIGAFETPLNHENPQGFHSQRERHENAIKEIQATLDAPNQRYQMYLRDVEAWERRRQEIVGTKETPDSLEFYCYQLEQVRNTIPDKLNSLRSDRTKAVRSIYRELVKQANVYREYYAPVLKALGNERGLLDAFGVSFDVVMDGSKFAHRLFDFVNQGISGTFCGVAEGRQRLHEMMPQGTFDTIDSTATFVETVVDALAHDMRDAMIRPNSLPKQLRKGVTPENIYDFLFTLEYLEPRYALKVGGRMLQELSPGERGLLLLVFYLIIDKDCTPLIIDQPEENLDNQSVKKILVPCIKTAKERRQLFVVTHNPNVAVVCDAEQIIYCSIDKADGSKVVYESGSIEDGIINRQLVDVLEGTAPAFENRTLKYRSVGSLE